MNGARLTSVLRLWPFALLALVGGAAAYYQVFGRFAAYDDEGYLLVSLQSFVDGGTLYDDVFTQYGPFYYQAFGPLFALTGRAVTTDAGRFIVLGIWILIAVLMAASAYGLTRSRIVALTTMGVAFTLLAFLGAEPMHPVGLVSLLLAIAVVAVSWDNGRRPLLAACVVGVCCGAIVMTKINIGGLAGVAVATALALAHARHGRARWFAWGAVALLALVPLVLLSGDLREDWVQRTGLLVLAGLACVVIVALRTAETATARDDRDVLHWLIAFLAGAVAIVVLSALVAVAMGSGPSALFAGIVTDPMGLRDIFTIPFALPDAVLDWAIVAVVAAVAWAFAPHARTPRVATAVVRLVAGFAVWVSVTGSSPLTFEPASGPLVVPVLVAWLVVAPPASIAAAAQQRLPRIMLALLAVLEVLQVYPVAGTQQYAAALLFLPLGAVLLHDGASELRATVGAPSPERMRWVALCLAVAAVGLLAKFVVLGGTRPLQVAHRNYDGNVSLGVNGAHRVHLSAVDAEGFRTLVNAIREQCDTFISQPGLNNLYIWTQIRPPTGLNAGDWMYLLDDERQQRVVDAVRARRRLCLVRNNEQFANWVKAAGDTVPPDRPLMRFIEDTRFSPVMSVLDGRYELLRR